MTFKRGFVPCVLVAMMFVVVGGCGKDSSTSSTAADSNASVANPAPTSPLVTDAQAQKILDQGMTFIKQNRYDVARQSLGQIQGMASTLSPPMVENIGKLSAAIYTAADTQAQTILDQAMTFTKENRYDVARQSVGQVQGMAWVLSPPMVENLAKVYAAIHAAADSQAQKILDQAMTFTRENRYDVARQSVGQVQGMAWVLSPPMVENLAKVYAAIHAAADTQAQTILDQATTYIKENRYDQARQSLGRVQGMAWALTPPMVENIGKLSAAIYAAADSRAQTILDQAKTHIKENRYDLARQALGRVQGMAWVLSPPMVENFGKVSSAVPAAADAKDVDSAAIAAADGQAQKLLDQVTTSINENKNDVAHELLGQLDTMTSSLSPTTIKAVTSARNALIASADGQAQKILDQVRTSIKENQNDKAHELLGQVDTMIWTLSPTTVKAIASARDALIASADAQAQVILDRVMTSIKENQNDKAHELLGQVDTMTWTLSPTTVKTIASAHDALIASADGQAQVILDRIMTSIKENQNDKAHELLGQVDTMTWTLSPTKVKAIASARDALIASADGQAQVILNRVMTSIKENKNDVAHQLLEQVDSMTWTLSPTTVKAIASAHDALTAAKERATG